MNVARGAFAPRLAVGLAAAALALASTASAQKPPSPAPKRPAATENGPALPKPAAWTPTASDATSARRSAGWDAVIARRASDAEMSADPFVVRSRATAASVAAAAAAAAAAATAAATPPPPPTAPPLPYRYLGRFVDGEAQTLFLAAGERYLAVRVGETIDGTHRVESASADRIDLRYLPLDALQQLPTTGTSSTNAADGAPAESAAAPVAPERAPSGRHNND